MAKLKRKFIKMRVEEESTYSAEALTERLENIIDAQYRKNLNKLRGASLSLWSRGSGGSYRLKYYHSYREDMCDTMMTIAIEKGMERSRVYGFIHKPAAIWACFWGIIGSLLIDFLVLSYCLLFVGGFDLINGLMISGAAILVRAYICVSLLEIDRKKAKILRDELFFLIRDKMPDRTDIDEYDADDGSGSEDDSDVVEIIDERTVRRDNEGD